jgi:hypothetical protein
VLNFIAELSRPDDVPTKREDRSRRGKNLNDFLPAFLTWKFDTGDSQRGSAAQT